jgi:hypothetical protein
LIKKTLLLYLYNIKTEVLVFVLLKKRLFILLITKIMACGTACATALPTVPTNDCNEINARPGGYNRFMLGGCEFDFSTLVDLATYEAAFAAGDIIASGYILGEKSLGSPTSKTFASCKTDVVTNMEKTIHIMDYHSCDTASSQFTEVDMYNAMINDFSSYYFAVIDCDDNVTGWIDGATASVVSDRVVEQTNQDNAYIDTVVTYRNKNIMKPIFVSGLNSLLDGVAVSS